MATGTRPRTLPIEGFDLPNNYTLRTVEDVKKMRPLIKEGTKVLIFGAGYIGLEISASAIVLGAKPIVAEAMDRVLARVAGQALSDFYQRVHTQHGVKIKLSSGVKRFFNMEKTSYVELNSGEKIEYHLAGLGVGVVPNVELAEQAGLVCDNGMTVNSYMQTSVADIYAIGDGANFYSQMYQQRLRIESVPNAAEQAKCATAAICGSPVDFNFVPWFWSDQYDYKLQTVGINNGYDTEIIRGDYMSGKFMVAYLKEGRLIALDAVKSPIEFMSAKRLIAGLVQPDIELLSDRDISLKTLL